MYLVEVVMPGRWRRDREDHGPRDRCWKSMRTRIAIGPGAIRSNEGWIRLMGSFPLDEPDR